MRGEPRQTEICVVLAQLAAKQQPSDKIKGGFMIATTVRWTRNQQLRDIPELANTIFGVHCAILISIYHFHIAKSFTY